MTGLRRGERRRRSYPGEAAGELVSYGAVPLKCFTLTPTHATLHNKIRFKLKSVVLDFYIRPSLPEFAK